MSSGRRLRSCPREKGMMQKEHMKLQPSCTFKFARVSWYSPMPSIAKSSRLTVRVWRISGAGRRAPEILHTRTVSRCGPARQRGQVTRQLHLVLRADDQIDAFHLLQHVRAGLGVAAGDGHEGVRGSTADLANQAAAVGFRVVRDGAGVDDHEIGALAELDQLVTATSELIAEQRRFSVIQATPDGMKRCAWHVRRGIITGGSASAQGRWAE